MTALDKSVEGFWAMGTEAKVFTIALLLIFSTVPSCMTIVSVKEKSASVLRLEAQAVIEKQRADMIDRLVGEYGFGPVAARCVVFGWSTDASRLICEQAGQRYHQRVTAASTE